MQLWPHQVYAVNEIKAAIAAGHRRICLQANTGAGKTLIMQRIVEWGRPTLILTNRVMLGEQLARGLDAAGFFFGMIASGYAPDIFERLQLASIQSLHKWWKEGRHELPEAEIVFLDEAHGETGQRATEILAEYEKRGATNIVVTATPVGISHMADHLIQAGYTSELRKCGALVFAKTYAPDEPDTRAFKGSVKTMLQFEDGYKEAMLPVIFGRVLEHYEKINPEGKPSLLFAPGVEESIWFCEKFNNAGIPWSHIDADRIIINGCEMAATRENREALMEASRTGKTAGVANRFVLREGIDMPWLEYGILACTFGSVSSYIQAGGRLLRQYYVDDVPQLESVCVKRGTLILTDRGEVPVEDVGIDDMVWDGIEFVTHSGAVCNGMRRTITWDGLTATYDHKVFTDNGWEKIAEAARWKRRITRSAVCGVPVRVPNYSDPHSSGQRRESACRSTVCEVWQNVLCEISQNREKAGKRVSSLHEQVRRTRARVDLSQSATPMEEVQRSQRQAIREIWRERDRIQVRFCVRGDVLDSGKYRHTRGQKFVTRQNRQQWELRSRESEVGHDFTTSEKHRKVQEIADEEILERKPSCWIHENTSPPSFQERHDGTADPGEVEQEVCEVWDITNAGPRHRYTAAGCLVGNCIADHGGNYWRFDSLNADREWSLEDTDKSIQDRHDELYRTKKEPEPIVCPQCSGVRKKGPVCPYCGFAYKGHKRMVIQTDGSLREVHGDVYKPRREAKHEDAAVKAWKACVYRCKAKGKTFAQARGLYMHENRGLVPGADFPLVPKYSSDWALPVASVPYERLNK